MMPSDAPHYPFKMWTDSFHWNRQEFVLVLDYYSRYWEIEKLYKTGAATTIKKIKNVVSRLGTPEIIKSDNGPKYNSSREFKRFAKDWGFQHVRSSPEYPRSNGLAEQTVQTAKNLPEKEKYDNKDPDLRVLEARNTSVDNYKSPAKLASGKQLWSILPINPNNLTVKSVDNDEFKQKRWTIKS